MFAHAFSKAAQAGGRTEGVAGTGVLVGADVATAARACAGGSDVANQERATQPETSAAAKTFLHEGCRITPVNDRCAPPIARSESPFFQISACGAGRLRTNTGSRRFRAVQRTRSVVALSRCRRGPEALRIAARRGRG